MVRKVLVLGLPVLGSQINGNGFAGVSERFGWFGSMMASDLIILRAFLSTDTCRAISDGLRQAGVTEFT